MLLVEQLQNCIHFCYYESKLQSEVKSSMIYSLLWYKQQMIKWFWIVDYLQGDKCFSNWILISAKESEWIQTLQFIYLLEFLLHWNLFSMLTETQLCRYVSLYEVCNKKLEAFSSRPSATSAHFTQQYLSETDKNLWHNALLCKCTGCT